MMKNFISFIACYVLISCQSALVPVTQRNYGMEKLAGNALSASPPREDEDRNSEAYVTRKKVKIAKKAPNVTGSLYMAKGPNNDLFKDMVPMKPSDTFDIRVVSGRMDKKSDKEEKKDKEAKKPQEKDASEAGKADDIVETMRNALPNLDMPQGQPPVIKYIKFRVLEIEESGDLKIAYHRSSKNQTDNREIIVTAILPRKHLTQGDELTTGDLTAVQWQEMDSGQRTERSSDGWEDEYTLRMSGFSEARSRIALELESKRQQLLDARKQLDAKLTSFKTERQQVGKDRQKLEELRLSMEKENRELRTQLEKVKPLSSVDSSGPKSQVSGDQGTAKSSVPDASGGNNNDAKAP